MNGWLEIAAVVGVVGWVLVRRMLGEPVEARRTLLLPAIVTVVGFADVTTAAQSTVSITYLVIVAAAGAAIGLWRGATVRVYARDGVVHLRYTPVTVALLVAGIAVKVASGLVLSATDPTAAHAAGSGLLLTLGVGLVAEGLVVAASALRADGTILWRTGRRGQPPTPWTGADTLRRNLSGTEGDR
jgi:hypothetical protein